MIHRAAAALGEKIVTSIDVPPLAGCNTPVRVKMAKHYIRPTTAASTAASNLALRHRALLLAGYIASHEPHACTYVVTLCHSSAYIEHERRAYTDTESVRSARRHERVGQQEDESTDGTTRSNHEA